MTKTAQSNYTFIPRPRSEFDRAATRFAREGLADMYVQMLEDDIDEPQVTRLWAKHVSRWSGVEVDVVRVPA